MGYTKNTTDFTTVYVANMPKRFCPSCMQHKVHSQHTRKLFVAEFTLRTSALPVRSINFSKLVCTSCLQHELHWFFLSICFVQRHLYLRLYTSSNEYKGVSRTSCVCNTLHLKTHTSCVKNIILEVLLRTSSLGNGYLLCQESPFRVVSYED